MKINENKKRNIFSLLSNLSIVKLGVYVSSGIERRQ